MDKISAEELYGESRHDDAIAADELRAFLEDVEGGFEGSIEEWRAEVAKKKIATTLPAPVENDEDDDIPF